MSELDDHTADSSPSSSDPSEEHAWQIYSPEYLATIIDHLSARRPSTLTLTYKYGMRSSRYKDDEVEWAQERCMGLADAVLSDMGKDIHQYNVRRMPFKGIAGELRSRPSFQAYRLQPGVVAYILRTLRARSYQWTERTSDADTLFTILYTYYNRSAGFTERDFRVTSTLREGVFERCSQTILLWQWSIGDYARKTEIALHKAEGVESADTEPQANTDHTHRIKVEGTKYHSSEKSIDLRAEPEPYLRLYHRLTQAAAISLQLTQTYEKAGKQRIPTDRHQDKRFNEVKPGQIRRLEERLPQEDTINAILAELKVLLNRAAYLPSRVRRAEKTRHPYLRSRKRQIRVRASVINQSSRKSKGQLLQLSELRPYQLERLFNELTDMKRFRKQLMPLRKDIALYLVGKPPAWPSVKTLVAIDSATWRRRFRTALEWFDNAYAFPTSATPDKWHRYRPEQLEEFESRARTELLRSEADPAKQRQHPLTFVRTMYLRHKKMDFRSFAVLYWEDTPTRASLEKRYGPQSDYRQRTKASLKHHKRRKSKPYREKKIVRDLAKGTRYRYAVAVTLHSPAAFKDYSDGVPPRQRPSRPSTAGLDPLMRRDYKILNAPYTEFPLKTKASILIFPLECGLDEENDEYPHAEERLNRLVEHHREAQQHEYQHQYRWQPSKHASYRSTHRTLTRQKTLRSCSISFQQERAKRLCSLKVKPIETCPPKAVLTTASIVSTVDDKGHHNLHLHLPVALSVPPVTQHVRKIIGFHPFNETYCYSLLTLDNHILEVGTIDLPSHVRRKEGEIYYSDAYVAELAKAMVGLAKQHNAYIGIEDTDYLKDEPSTSRAENRERFAVPFGKLCESVERKALLAGLPAPHLTRYVPWENACGQCGTHLKAGTVAFRHQSPRVCDDCLTIQPDRELAIPLLLNAVSVIYNLIGIRQLQLSGTTLAGILLGAITKWNDTRIAADNPGAALPDIEIIVVPYVDDGVTGRTLVAYLRNVVANPNADARWAEWFNHGQGHLAIRYGNHETNVRERVKQMAGTIGFAQWQQSSERGVQVAAIRNQSGACVRPTRKTIGVGATIFRHITVQDEQPNVLTTSSHPHAYAITGVTWAAIPKEQANAGKAKEIIQFLQWVAADGCAIAEQRNYIAVPREVRTAALQRLQLFNVAGQQVVEVMGKLGNPSHGEQREDQPEQYPRIALVSLTGTGAANAASVYEEWATKYRTIAPNLSVVFERVSILSEPQAPTTLLALEGTTTSMEGQNAKLINACAMCGGNNWSDSLWFGCSHCETDVLAQYNTAIVVARMTLEQLVRRYEQSNGKNSPDPTLEDGTVGDDSWFVEPFNMEG